MTAKYRNPALDIFARVENEIISTFRKMYNALRKRENELLARLDRMKQVYLRQEDERQTNLREINELIEQIEKTKPRQFMIHNVQQEYLQTSKLERQKYENPIVLNTYPKFIANRVESLARYLESIGTVEEVETVYRAKSTPDRRIVSDNTEGVAINRPMGVTLDGMNRVYVANLGSAQVQLLTLDGQLVTEFGCGKLSMPHSIAICNKNVFVSDFALNSIVKFQRPDYNMVDSTKKGELNWPLGITVDKNQSVLVADSKNNRVVVYSFNFDVVGEFGQHLLNEPQDVKMCLDDSVIVADHGAHNNIHVFSSTGQSLRSLVKLANGGSWLFLSFDIFGNILISDYAGKRIQVVAEDGAAIPNIECKYYATGIAVAENNQTIVAEFTNNRINLYN